MVLLYAAEMLSPMRQCSLCLSIWNVIVVPRGCAKAPVPTHGRWAKLARVEIGVRRRPIIALRVNILCACTTTFHGVWVIQDRMATRIYANVARLWLISGCSWFPAWTGREGGGVHVLIREPCLVENPPNGTGAIRTLSWLCIPARIWSGLWRIWCASHLWCCIKY